MYNCIPYFDINAAKGRSSVEGGSRLFDSGGATPVIGFFLLTYYFFLLTLAL